MFLKIPKEYFFTPERYEGAKSWDDLSNEQLLRVAHILDSKEDALWKLERLSVVLMGIEKGILYIVYEDAVALTEFIFKGTKRTKIPFEKLRMGLFKKAFYAPADGLSNITFGEFIKADTAFMNYAKKGDIKQLDRLCAILYRPRKTRKELKARDFNGDAREPFNSNTIDRRLKAISKLPKVKKLAIMAYFAGSKAKIAGRCTHIFQTGGKGEGGGSWLGPLRQFSNHMIEYESILDSRANLVLYEMNQSAKEAKEHNEYLESLK